MSPSPQVHPRLVTLVRWVAHVLSVVILFFFAVMLGGEVMQGQTPNLKPQEILIFVAVAAELIGLLIAFRKETPGGLMVLVGFLLQAVVLPKSALTRISRSCHSRACGDSPAPGSSDTRHPHPSRSLGSVPRTGSPSRSAQSWPCSWPSWAARSS